MENVIGTLNWIFAAAFILCFGYQLLLLPAAYLGRRRRPEPPGEPLRYAFLVAARNEAGVIGALLESIRQLDYPRDRVDIFVVADNCTDDTAGVARRAGAVVYERRSADLVGKGYALDFLLRQMRAEGAFGAYDGFLVFDADNLLAPDYLRQMDKVFRTGYPVVTSYRNATNPTASWVAAGSAVLFLRESQLLNRGRMLLGASSFVSGTGFLLSRALLEEVGGWPFHTLTEDYEFTAYCILHEIPIGYCQDAMFFDEQPVRFGDSYRQRLRWVRGAFQMYRKYGLSLWKGVFTKRRLRARLSCFDLLMASMPAFFLMVFELLALAVCAAVGLAAHLDVGCVLLALVRFLGGSYLGLALMFLFLLVTEYRRFPLSPGQTLKTVFTAPAFLFTYIPVALQAACFFRPVTWTPIVHTGVKT